MRNVVHKRILEIKPYIPGKPIEEAKRELGLNSVIKLASNESPYGPSPMVLKAISQAAKTVNRYPDGDCFYLRQALAKGVKVNPRQLIFGNGSDEIIVLAIKAFVKEGDSVVIAKPSFLIYDIASKIAGATIKAVPLKNFRYDLPAMKAAVNEETRIIFLGNPDNPAGRYLTQREVEDFVGNLNPNILVFIDEAYFEFVDAKDYVNSIGLLTRHKNVLVTRTFSKMYGLAGLRIGYGIGDEELIDILNRIREPFNVNSLAQAAALACLKDKKYYRAVAQKLRVQKKFLYESFKKLNLDFILSDTNFILIKLQENSREVTQKLLKKGVIVRDMGFWGMENFIRVTIGSQVENRKLIKVLETIK